MTINEALNYLVNTSARSKTAFARRIGISRQCLHDMLSNRRGVSVRILMQICRASGYRLILMPEENYKPVDSIEIDDI